jgi:hypothetical protein
MDEYSTKFALGKSAAAAGSAKPGAMAGFAVMMTSDVGLGDKGRGL